MKKILFILFVAIFVFSCCNKKNIEVVVVSESEIGGNYILKFKDTKGKFYIVEVLEGYKKPLSSLKELIKVGSKLGVNVRSIPKDGIGYINSDEISILELQNKINY